MTKEISCFDPVVATKSSLRSARLNKALNIAVENNLVSGFQADNIKRLYITVCNQSLFDETMSNFSTQNHRLDDLWLEVIPASDDYKDLRLFLKIILILSHGNAFSESGFSINKEILVENLTEESLIGQRRVYDAIQYHGGVENIEINKSLIHAVRNSHDRYQEALNKKREQKDDIAKEKAKKRQITDKLRELSSEKSKILSEAHRKVEEIDLQIKQIE